MTEHFNYPVDTLLYYPILKLLKCFGNFQNNQVQDFPSNAAG